MKVLLSAFACSPLWGSEPGVGWQWVKRIALRHDVTLITHRFFEDHIEPALRKEPLPRLTIRYVDLPAPVRPHRYLNSRLYYFVWQIAAALAARDLVRTDRFDVAHHLTWGTFRFPSFLPFVVRPFVFGPVGGAELAPMRLTQSLPPRVRLFELARQAWIRSSALDPILSLMYRKTDLVLAKTQETLDALPRSVRARSRIAHEIGSGSVDEPESRRIRLAGEAPLALLYAGRLIGWKGVHLVIDAALALQARGVDFVLHIAGDGGLSALLKRRAGLLGSRIVFHGKLTRQRLYDLYLETDVLVFPSLHDSSGNVVIEALSRGQPVVCLDLGGPRYFIDEECGRVVSTSGRDEAAVAVALAQAIEEFADPTVLAKASGAAIRRSTVMPWEHQVQRGYEIIEQHLNGPRAAYSTPRGRQ